MTVRTDAADEVTDAPSVTVGESEYTLREVGRLLVGASVLGGYAAWAGADLLPRWLAFLVVALSAGYLLASNATARAQMVVVGYGLATLLAVTPALMILPDVLSAGSYGVALGDVVFLRWNLYLFVVFFVPALVVAALTARLDGRDLRP